nr:glycosyltransferase family 4 protein [uncultured Albidiferax sp.]
MSIRVVVVQRRMTHYRVAFFEELRSQLQGKGIELTVAYGQGTTAEEKKDDSADIAWGVKLKTKYYLNGRICFQPLKEIVKNADLLVLTLENKLICNIWHQFFKKNYKIILWGHGANLQGDFGSYREKFKKILVRKADWWFVYTAMGIPIIKNAGYPENRVKVLNNSIDTESMQRMMAVACALQSRVIKEQIEIFGNNVAIYVGSLYEEKRIEFMLEAAVKIREKISDFELIVVGAGSHIGVVKNYCVKYKWIKYLGAKKNQEKINLISLAKVMLNPGAVGLGVLDSFVCQVPLATTDCGLHGPEIVYLENHVNGLMSKNSLPEYVSCVVDLLKDDAALARLRNGCAEGAKKYTVKNMATNFIDGLKLCAAEVPFR